MHFLISVRAHLDEEERRHLLKVITKHVATDQETLENIALGLGENVHNEYKVFYKLFDPLIVFFLLL